MINVAIVGFGKLGLLHAGLFNALPGARLGAVVDANAALLKVVKSRMEGVRAYSNVGALLKDGGTGAIIVATPTGAHVDVALAAVEQGIPVLVEKPLSLSAAQAKPLVAALEDRPVANMVGYMGRFIETFAKGKEIVASGALGKPQIVRSSMYVAQLFAKGKGWRYNSAQSGGGVLITQNSHLVDKLRWLFGDVEWVSGHVRSLYSTAVEDYAHVALGFESGLLATMDASWSARHYRTPSISIHVQGERGTLDMTDDQVRLYLDKDAAGYPAGWSQWRKPDLYQGVTFDIGGTQYTRQAEAFLAGVRGEAPIGSDVPSAYRVQAAIDAIYASARENGAPMPISGFL